MKTLWEKFYDAPFSSTAIPWRIFEKSTRKLLCDDYGAATGMDGLDDREFYKAEKKRFKNGLEYWRVVVY